MAHFPQCDPTRRAPRKQLAETIPINIVVDGRVGIHGTLQTISSTGGCALVTTEISEGALAEVVVTTKFGPVRAIAEMLKVKVSGTNKAQPFRFIALSEDDQERLKYTLQELRETA
jgi:hypothetical protein